MQRFTLFDTPISYCALAWTPNGILRVQLPEADKTATRKRLTDSFPRAREAAPDTKRRDAIDAINELLDGERRNLEFIVLDMQGIPAFHRRVYEATRHISPGTIQTYGEIARQIDAPRAARAVGQALSRNPFPLIVPCHRVVAANGKLGGFTAHGGVSTKRLLLSLEKKPATS